MHPISQRLPYEHGSSTYWPRVVRTIRSLIVKVDEPQPGCALEFDRTYVNLVFCPVAVSYRISLWGYLPNCAGWMPGYIDIVEVERMFNGRETAKLRLLEKLPGG